MSYWEPPAVQEASERGEPWVGVGVSQGDYVPELSPYHRQNTGSCCCWVCAHSPQSQALRDNCFYTSISRHSQPCPSLNLASSGHSTAGRHPGPPGMSVLSVWDIMAITSLPPWALEYVCPKCLTLSQESSSFSLSGHNNCVSRDDTGFTSVPQHSCSSSE